MLCRRGRGDTRLVARGPIVVAPQSSTIVCAARGHTDHRTMWICYGKGRNGKSTYMNLIQLILKDMYAVLSESALID